MNDVRGFMDKTTLLEELKKEVKQFCTEREWDQFHGAKDLSIGLSTEAAELLEIFRFKKDTECDQLFEGKERQNIEDEMGDVLFFLVRIAQKYEVDLASAFFNKMAKNRSKYPMEKARGSNKKYTEL
jgi:NTP pyrophosphatase (non-canonical NTP hydrolase)